MHVQSVEMSEHPISFYSVVVRWNSEDMLHVFEVTCDKCGITETFKVGKNYNRPTEAAVNWMINHRRVSWMEDNCRSDTTCQCPDHQTPCLRQASIRVLRHHIVEAVANQYDVCDGCQLSTDHVIRRILQ